MGNFSKGVRSESANVGAKWPERNSAADAQSLKRRPPLRSGFCSWGTAKAPSTTAGASFNNSRRLMLLTLRLAVRVFISAFLAGDSNEIRESAKSYRGAVRDDIGNSSAAAST